MEATRIRYAEADGNARALMRGRRMATRRQFTPGEKVKIVIEAIRSEMPISTLCRTEGTATGEYYD